MDSEVPAARLTEGSIAGHLVRLTLPMIWGLLAVIGFNVVDTFFVGQLGKDELAAISFTFPVVMIAISLGVGLGAGTSAVLARAVGARDHARVRRIGSDALLLALVVSLLFSALGLATIEPLFRLLGAASELLPLIRGYLTIWYPGVAFLVVSMVAMGAIRATGDSRVPGRVLVGSALVNLVLDPLLIFGLLGFPRLEMEGAAIATVIARAAGLVASLLVLRLHHGILQFAWPGLAALLASWRAVLHVGLPAVGTNVISPLATAAVVAMVATFGKEAVAGFGVATRIEAVTLVVFFAMSSIIGPFVGQNLGAGRKARIIESLRLSFLFCLVFGALIALGLWLFGGALAGLFNPSPEVIAVAALYLVIVPVSYGGAGAVSVVNAAFNGLGQPIRAVAVSLARMVVVYLPFAYLGAELYGVKGIFFAAALANLGVGLGAYVWIRDVCRHRMAAHGPPHDPGDPLVP